MAKPVLSETKKMEIRRQVEDQLRQEAKAEAINVPTGPWKQTASRKAFRLIDPLCNEIDFDVDIAGPLSRLARYTGDTTGGAYSVAQHCVVGADFVSRHYCSDYLAAAFLLHDAHEAYIGDIATPAQDAINWHIQNILDDVGLFDLIRRNIPDLAGNRLFKLAMRRLKDQLDAAIYAAAGLTWPPPSDNHRIPNPTDTRIVVKTFDTLMLALETDAYMGGEVAPWGATTEVRTSFSLSDFPLPPIWSAERAEREFQLACRRYLPTLAEVPMPVTSKD